MAPLCSAAVGTMPPWVVIPAASTEPIGVTRTLQGRNNSSDIAYRPGTKGETYVLMRIDQVQIDMKDLPGIDRTSNYTAFARASTLGQWNPRHIITFLSASSGSGTGRLLANRGPSSTTKEGTPRMVMRKLGFLGLAASFALAFAGVAEAKHHSRHSHYSSTFQCPNRLRHIRNGVGLRIEGGWL